MCFFKLFLKVLVFLFIPLMTYPAAGSSKSHSSSPYRNTKERDLPKQADTYPSRRSSAEVIITKHGAPNLYHRAHWVEKNRLLQKLRKTDSDTYKLMKEIFNELIQEGSSGAWLWAHRHNILGQGVKVGIIDDSSGKVGTQHAENIAEDIKAVAPKAQLRFYEYQYQDISVPPQILEGVDSDIEHVLGHDRGKISNPYITPMHMHPSSAFKSTPEHHSKADIVNISLGLINRYRTNYPKNPEALEQYRHVYRRLVAETLSLQQKRLVIVSAGNQRTPMHQMQYISLEGENIIYAGSGHSLNMLINEPFSNYPGKNKSIQKRFLYALGDIGASHARALGLTERKKFRSQWEEAMNKSMKWGRRGTSYAAPIITGAAALILSKYPGFKGVDLAEILLESADRSFVYTMFLDGKYKVGFVLNSRDPKSRYTRKNMERLKEKNKDLIYDIVEYNPEFYGKGLLNIKSALIYAEIKKNNPGMRPRGIRLKMMDILAQQNNKAATKIQRAFRKHLKRKKKHS